uniref:Uncharacterized protein n=1 Tax=Clastoptera arizonana TaxID=38151 RepID=A0A1B6D7N1_9HEMI
MLCLRIIIFVVINAQVNCMVSLSDIGDVISFTHEVVSDVLKTWEVLSPIVQGPDRIDLPLLKDKEKRLLTRISDVSRKVDTVDRHLQYVASATKLNLEQDIPTQVRTDIRLDALLELVSMIQSADKSFQEYINLIQGKDNSTVQLEQHTLENFAIYVVSHSPDSVQGILSRIHHYLSPDGSYTTKIFQHKGLFQLVIKALQVSFLIFISK